MGRIVTTRSSATCAQSGTADPGRLRVYTSFAAAGSKNPAATDLKYYFLLRAWLRRGRLTGAFVDVHQAPVGQALRRPTRATLEAELRRRLAHSDLLLLILSSRTPACRGWLDWEIGHGVGTMGLPLLCTYVGMPQGVGYLGVPAWWPPSLFEVSASRPELVVGHARFCPRELAQDWGRLLGARPGRAAH